MSRNQPTPNPKHPQSTALQLLVDVASSRLAVRVTEHSRDLFDGEHLGQLLGWQIRIGLIGFGGILSAIVAAACESTAADQNQFLMYPSRHDLTVRRRKLDVDGQPHTIL